MNIAIEPAGEAHVRQVLANLREHDKPLFDSIPHPAETLCEAIRQSSQSYAVLLDGEVMALWGAEIRSILDDSVFVWMVTTPLAEQHPIPFARRATAIAKRFLAEYGRIEGTVVTYNTVAIKWVTWLGAELTETETPGVLIFRLRQSSHPRWRA